MRIYNAGSFEADLSIYMRMHAYTRSYEYTRNERIPVNNNSAGTLEAFDGRAHGSLQLEHLLCVCVHVCVCPRASACVRACVRAWHACAYV